MGRLTVVILSSSFLGASPVPELYEEDGPDLSSWSSEKAALGRKLFHDKRLSRDNSLACSGCHDPAKAFTDGRPVAIGIGGAKGGRNTPTIINRALGESQFWDGRAKTLKEQALGPMFAPIEMGMDAKLVVKRVQADPSYVAEFKKVFGGKPTVDGVAEAIAEYEKSVYSVDAPFDRFMSGDINAMTVEQQRGLALFGGKARCGECHTGPNFSDELFHVLGVSKQEGRGKVTGNQDEMGAYKTPTLRDVVKTAPYMHDGSIATLEEVIEFYNKGGEAHPNLSDKMKKLDLTDPEKKDLLAFMNALSGRIVEYKPN